MNSGKLGKLAAREWEVEAAEAVEAELVAEHTQLFRDA